MRGAASLVVVMLLTSASLEGQAGPRGSQSVRVVKPEAPPAQAHAPAPAVDARVAPAKPVVQTAVQGAKPVVHVEAKPAAQAAAKPGAPATPPAPPKAPTKSLEEAAESIAAALKARGVRPPSRARAESEPAPRAPRIKRYALYWPPDDTKWDVQWPTSSGRVALTWDEPAASDQPASN